MVQLTRNALFERIAHASIDGTLGLFVGTGFSKATTNGLAPTFKELINKLIISLGISMDIDNDTACKHKSLPQIASLVLRTFIEQQSIKGITYEEANTLFRENIADLCNIAPRDTIAAEYANTLRDLRPSWAITTNYDLILEMLIPRSVSVLAYEPFSPRRTLIPVYHLHGHRLNVSSIKITEEDYVDLLAASDYQKHKLPLLLYESTTLMLGYDMGDINVRTALAWSTNLIKSELGKNSAQTGSVIQALWTKAPRTDPYKGKSGEYIIEISNLLGFLKELTANIGEHNKAHEVAYAALEHFLADPSTVKHAAIDGSTERQQFISLLPQIMHFSSVLRVTQFLDSVLGPMWSKAREDLGFSYYNDYLKLLIEIMENIDIDTCGPLLFNYLADALDKLGWYIDPEKTLGSAHEATDTWIAEHKRISDKLKKQLQSYANANDRFGLMRMMEII